jgi:hypothetical protein
VLPEKRRDMSAPVYDKFEALYMDAQLAVSILGNADVTDIEMLPMKPYELSPEKIQELVIQWAGRGLRFIGAIGIVDGKPRTALAVPLDDRRISALSQAFIAYCEVLLSGSVEEQQKGDSVTWLHALHSLPDTRMN